MPYGTIYRLKYDSIEGAVIVTHICDQTTFSPGATTTFIDIIATGISISVVDAGRNKFAPIRAKKIDISFMSTDTVTARTFAVGEDNRWYVEHFVEGTTNEMLFIGYLLMDGHQQPFLPPGLYSVNLVGTDNLGVLKDVAMTKDDLTNPRGHFKIIQYVAWCLKKTGLRLPIVVTDTWIEQTQTTLLPAFNSTYLQSKTFESDINVSLDCYRCLEMILGQHLSLFQRHGEWYIASVDEMTGANTYRFQFDADGVYVSTLAPTTFVQTIGLDQPIKLINKDALITFTRPFKSAKLTFKYNFPIEIIDNIDFSRGTIPIPSITVDTGLFFKVYANLAAFPAVGESDKTYKATNTGFFYKWRGTSYIQITGSQIPVATAYVIDDWTLLKNSDNAIGSDGLSYVVKIVEIGIEKSRYAVIKNLITSYKYIKSNRIPVESNDKFVASVDVRYLNDVSGSGFYRHGVMQVKLYGEDGSFWTLHGGTSVEILPKWYSTNSAFTTNNRYIVTEGNLSEDLREWKSTTGGDCPPIPVNGELEILLLYTNNISTEIHLSNLRFDYLPFINGSYQRFTGHTHTVSQTANYKQKYEEEVFLSDSPKSLFKGTMFKLVASKYIRTTDWYSGGDITNQGLSLPPASQFIHPYNFIQVFAVWNQVKRRFIELSGSMVGLRLTNGTNTPDLNYIYNVVAGVAVPETDNKKFVLLSYETDSRAATWSGTFAESYDTAHTYDDPYEFKYLTDDQR